MPSWSNPDPGPSPAVLQHGFEVHAAPIAGVLESIMRQREQQQKQMQQTGQDVARGVAGYMNQQKQDQIAQTLLDSESNYDNPNPTDLESIARSLNESDARPSQAYAVFDKEKADRMKEALQTAETNRYNAQAGAYKNPPSPNAMYDDSGNIIGYSSGKTGAPHLISTPKADPWAGSIPIARGKLDADGNFTNDYPEAATGDQVKLATPSGKTMVVPWGSYQGKVGKSSIAPDTGGATDTSVEPAPITSQNEVTRTTKDGRQAIFDSTTQQFLRWADGG